MSTEVPLAIPRRVEQQAEPAPGPEQSRDQGEGRSLADGVGSAPEEPGATLARLERALRDGRAPQSMLAALVAWTITVAPGAFARSGPASARVAAVLAVICGVSAPLLAVLRRRLARHLGISCFLALSTLTWLLASPAIQPSRLDPIRAAIGAVAWGVFALSWRDRWLVRRQGEPDVDAPVLKARALLPPLSAAIVAASAFAGVAFLVLAWRVRDPERALFAHAVAVACAVALVSVASSVAVGRGRHPSSGSRRLTHHAVRPLLLLIGFALLGAVMMMLR